MYLIVYLSKVKRLYISFTLLRCLLFVCGVALAEASDYLLGSVSLWQPIEPTATLAPISTADIDLRQPSTLYAANQSMLYIVDSETRGFRFLQSFGSAEDRIQGILSYADSVDIVTAKGLFTLEGTTEKITLHYRSASTEEETLLDSMRTDQQQILATTKGLYYREMRNARVDPWKTIPVLSRTPIYDLAKDQSFVYALASNTLYRLPIANPDDAITILKAGPQQQSDKDALAVEAIDGERQLLAVAVYSDAKKPSHIVVVSTKGLLVSTDSGTTWQSVGPPEGFFKSVTALVLVKRGRLVEKIAAQEPSLPYYPTVLSATGIYQWQGAVWQSLYRGLSTKRINDLKMAHNTLYAATDQGLFRWAEEAQEDKAVPAPGKLSYRVIEQHFAREPSIQTVHQWAIQYGEVNKEKIDAWREQARKRAWLPEFDVGLDVDRDWDRSDSLWGSSSGSHHQGPADHSYGKGVSWGVSMSWDLADLVWNSSQTSIDSRSKLMVELREDIIGQVTRIYFERRRLQIELLQGEATQVSPLESQLRIAELTALIDGFTGGKFSHTIDSGQ